jgi:uncharacterized SAM-binding protein YcdF (DUF218 family)
MVIEMSLLFGLCLALGIASLIYFGIIVIYAGIGSAFAGFWLVAGVGLVLFGLVCRYIEKNEIHIPGIFKLSFFTLLLVGVLLFSFIEVQIISYAATRSSTQSEYLIVLGAQVRGTTVSNSLKKRLETAVVYLEENPQTIVIVSGGQGAGEDISEAEAMKRFLSANGIAEERIKKEDQSTSTNENISFSKKIINDENAEVTIVTNNFHVFRAVSIAKKQGYHNVVGLSAPADKILLLNYYVREAAGILKDKIVGNM